MHNRKPRHQDDVGVFRYEEDKGKTGDRLQQMGTQVGGILGRKERGGHIEHGLRAGMSVLRKAVGGAGVIYFTRLPIDGTLFGYLGEFVLCGLAACGYGILLVIFLAVGFCQRTKELTNRR